ncbi:MAG TPA: condensation domain-containing protein, partial [Pseudonocardiaceae bacterium]
MSEWVVPASYGQERLWFVDQAEPGSPAFNIVTSVRLPFPVSADEVRRALGVVVGRHEALRTSLRAVDDVPHQVVHPEVAVDVPEHDGDPEALLAALAVTPIPLDDAPLWRAALARVPDGWLLGFVAHHAVFDGASIPVLRAELTELCESTVDGRPAALPELAIQYPDFAAWQRDQDLTAGLCFWRAELAGLPAVHAVPTDRPRPPHGPAPGGDVLVDLPDSTGRSVAALARAARTTPFAVYLAACAALVQRLSDQDDVVLGVPVGGRHVDGTQPLVGMFVNTVPLRVDLGGDLTFGALLERVRDTVARAWEHQDTPFQHVVRAVAPPRDPAVAPVCQLGFNYLPDLGTGTGNGVARDDLLFGLTDRDLRLEFNAALFDRDTALRIAHRYRRLLAAAVAEPDRPLWTLPVFEEHPPTGLLDRAGAPVPPGVAGRTADG